MVYKIGLKSFTDIIYNGEEWQLNNDYWTTVEANGESEAKRLATHNLCIRIAKTEWFTNRNVRCYKNIYIHPSDMVVGE